MINLLLHSVNVVLLILLDTLLKFSSQPCGLISPIITTVTVHHSISSSFHTQITFSTKSHHRSLPHPSDILLGLRISQLFFRFSFYLFLIQMIHETGLMSDFDCTLNLSLLIWFDLEVIYLLCVHMLNSTVRWRFRRSARTTSPATITQWTRRGCVNGSIEKARYLLSTTASTLTPQSTTVCYSLWHSFYWVISPLSSTWPHLNSDVGLEEGEYYQNCLCAILLCSISAMHIAQS